jgi:hypothetical protein
MATTPIDDPASGVIFSDVRSEVAVTAGGVKEIKPEHTSRP